MSRDKPLHVLSAIPLEPAHREKITGADPRILLHYPEDLMPARRYEGDKVGHPMEWTDDMEARWRKLLREAEVLFGFDRRNLANLPTLAPNLRWIQGSSTGIGGVVSAHGWADHNIITTSARGIHAEPLGEFHAFAILAFAKDLPRMQEQKANHHFQRYCTGRVRGKTLGVIGLGKNGKAVVRMGRALGMRVVGMKRHWEPPTMWRELAVDHLYPLDALHDMLAECDFVSLTPPATPETEGLIDARALAAMKPGAVLINTSRGTVVDEAALVQALKEEHLGGAALDVFEVEPLPADSPLWELDNVLIMPHSASCAEGEDEELTDLFVANLLRYLEDRPLLNVINPDTGY